MYHLGMDTTQPQITEERSEDVSDAEPVAEELELVEEISIDGIAAFTEIHLAVLDSPLKLHPSVALRPEPFGALAYHYDNRRLIF